ncbi:uncharacterized protein KY384_000454 [Bacidia gigantensis]|uniref:uncharacterized protein n=1 Tax=Bacidia gigantensis TaxID=2732470 RepID=UPI001D051C58|nr:uncharacterized protein KY384_000454 [Bacidia gigantensis]KAG8525694.1 hypothetical protein KY384_000454 [Bacidia gigantensis]
MTVTGQVKTLTITPTGPPAPTQTIVDTKQAENSGGFFSSPGKVAGTFVAVALIIVAALICLLFLLLRRRRRQQQQEKLPSTAGSGTPQRRPSRMSQMGLIAAAGSGSQREKREPPTIQTTGWGPGNSAERSPADTLDKRSSYPRFVDQRLEPTAVWNPLHDNGSHVSIRSFRDDQDYSRRMLRIANPDQ